MSHSKSPSSIRVSIKRVFNLVVKQNTIVSIKIGTLIMTTIILLCVIFQPVNRPLSAQQPETASTSRDTRALASMKLSLSSLSGTSSWSTTTSAHLSGTITTVGKNKSGDASFDWEDEWSGRSISSRHTRGTGRATQVLIQNPNLGRMMQRQDKSTKPAGARSTFPPVELPGAYLSVALNDPKCSFHGLDEQPNGEVDIYSVQIVCLSLANARGAETTVWTFSERTHLPTSVTTELSDLRIGGRRLNETVRFTHFRLANGLMNPDSMELKIGGLTQEISVQTMELPDASQHPLSDFEVAK